MLFTSPSGAVQIVAIWIGILGCILLPNNRCLIMIFLTIPPLIANILLLKRPVTAGWGLIVPSWLMGRKHTPSQRNKTIIDLFTT